MTLSRDWRSAPVSEVCEQIVDCINKTAPTVVGPTPFKMIRTTNVRNGWVDTEHVRFVTEDTYKAWTRRGAPRPGDVLLTREAPLGGVGLLRSTEPVFLGQRLVMYRADPAQLDNRFLLYSLMGYDLQGQIKAMGSGATVEHMRVPDCEKLVLRLPALPVQERIGYCLGSLDDLIEANQRRIAILEEMARLIYEEWFVKLRFPGHEKVQFVDSELGRIPEGWEVVPIRGLVTLQRKAVQPKNFPGELFEHFSFPAFDSGQQPALDPGESIRSGKYEVPNNSLLVPKLNPHIPRVWLPFPAGKHRAVASTEYLILEPTRYSRWFLYAYFTSPATREMLGGRADGTSTSHKRLKPDDLMSRPIIAPDDDLVRRFDEIADPALRLAYELRMRNEVLHTSRELLLPRLISGEVDVSNIELPAEEVAA